MGKASRQKGARGERQVADIFRDWGWHAERNTERQSRGQETRDLIVYPEGQEELQNAIEISITLRGENLHSWHECVTARWVEVAEGLEKYLYLPVLFFRGNQQPWHAMTCFHTLREALRPTILKSEHKPGPYPVVFMVDHRFRFMLNQYVEYYLTQV